MKISSLLLMALLACIVGTPVFADSHGNFSGRGSKEAYDRSLQISVQALEASKRKDYQKAIELDNEAIGTYPYESQWHNNLGCHLRFIGKLEAAQKAEEQALVLEPTFVGAWIDLGVCFETMHKLADAERCYRKAVEFDPKSYGALGDLGDILRQEGKFEEARQWLLKAKNCPESAKFPGEIDKMLIQCEQPKKPPN